MSWADTVGPGLPFGIENLPYGVFVPDGESRSRIGVRIGDFVLDIGEMARRSELPQGTLLRGGTLNPLMAAGPTTWSSVRDALTSWVLDEDCEELCRDSAHAIESVEMQMPFSPADYVDFLSSEQHAMNGGRIMRPNASALPPSWYHMPIGYHGRAGSIVVSDTPLIRPRGQRLRPGEQIPTFGPTHELDFEAEVGFVVGIGSDGPVKLADWREHVFGVFLLNDWSARDVQSFEAAPLGPFLGKSFMTSISPWVVQIAALERSRVSLPIRREALAPYLDDTGQEWGLDIALVVSLNGEVISRPPFRTMYWSVAQQLAHLTANGGSLRCGDVFASGTVSGTHRDQWGSLLEISWRGADPIQLRDGSTRSFLEDGDTVTIGAIAIGSDGVEIGFGEVRGVVGPALSHGA